MKGQPPLQAPPLERLQHICAGQLEPGDYLLGSKRFVRRVLVSSGRTYFSTESLDRRTLFSDWHTLTPVTVIR